MFTLEETTTLLSLVRGRAQYARNKVAEFKRIGTVKYERQVHTYEVRLAKYEELERKLETLSRAAQQIGGLSDE